MRGPSAGFRSVVLVSALMMLFSLVGTQVAVAQESKKKDGSVQQSSGKGGPKEKKEKKEKKEHPKGPSTEDREKQQESEPQPGPSSTAGSTSSPETSSRTAESSDIVTQSDALENGGPAASDARATVVAGNVGNCGQMPGGLVPSGALDLTVEGPGAGSSGGVTGAFDWAISSIGGPPPTLLNDGTYTGDSTALNLSNVQVTIFAIAVKGGPWTNIYTSAVQNMISPLNAGLNVPAISHFTICYGPLEVVEPETGSLGVAKTLAGDGSPDPTATFTIEVDCDDDAFDTTLTFGATGALVSGTSPITDIPEGTQCTVTETGTGGADSVSYSPHGGTQSMPPTVTIVADTTVTVTVTNVFVEEVPETGSLGVLKALAGDGEPDPTATFTIEVDCDDDAFDTTLTFGATGALVSGTSPITGIPVGTECTVTETGTGDADSVSYNPHGGTPSDPPTVTIVADTTVTVTVTNVFVEEVPATGSLQVVKLVDGTGSPAPGTEFEIRVDCGDFGTFTLVFDESGDLVSGTSPITGIPVGTQCSVDETGDGDADSVTFNPDPPEVEITEDGQELTVTVTNTFDGFGSLEVLKVVDGTGTPASGTTFTIEVDCGDFGTFTLVFDESGDLVSGTSPITGIPVGTECTVDETGDGEADSVTFNPDPPEVEITEDGEEITVTVTNTFALVLAAPLIAVDKTNDADGDGTFTDSEIGSPGDSVEFRVVISNPGVVPITLLSIVDVFPGEPGLDVCGHLIGTVVAPGGSVTCFFTIDNYVPAPGESLVNTVTVTGHHEDDPVEDSDTSAVGSLPLVLAAAAEISARAEEGAAGPAELAVTGFGLLALLLLAAGLLTAGGGLEWWQRRSRRRSRA